MQDRRDWRWVGVSPLPGRSSESNPWAARTVGGRLVIRSYSCFKANDR